MLVSIVLPIPLGPGIVAVGMAYGSPGASCAALGAERDILRGAVADRREPRRVPGRMILGALLRLVSLEDGMSRHYHSTVERKELKFQ